MGMQPSGSVLPIGYNQRLAKVAPLSLVKFNLYYNEEPRKVSCANEDRWPIWLRIADSDYLWFPSRGGFRITQPVWLYYMPCCSGSHNNGVERSKGAAAEF